MQELKSKQTSKDLKKEHGSKHETSKHGITKIDLRKGTHKSMQKDQTSMNMQKEILEPFIELGCLNVGLDQQIKIYTIPKSKTQEKGMNKTL